MNSSRTRWTLRRHAALGFGLSSMLAPAVVPAETPGAAAPDAASPGAAAAAPDTSEWTCAHCPFLEGYTTRTEAGVDYADGANAHFGRYTGIDHTGPYADVSADGAARSATGTYGDYDLRSLGLKSRDGYLEAGREGLFDVRLNYDGQPARLFDQGNLGTQRDTTTLSARYFASASWTLFGEYRRIEKTGNFPDNASFLTDALQFVAPVDYVTNSIEGGVAWSGRQAGLRLTYTGSWFTDGVGSIDFTNPFAPIVPGSTQGELAAAPDNRLEQFSAAGNLQLPWTTSITYGASLGTLRQNASFLPASTLSGAVTPEPGSLDGKVRLSHYNLGLASRPWRPLSLRGSAAYDGRDDKTPPASIAYTVTDTFPGGTAIAPRYGEDRVRLDGGADLSWVRWLRLGVGGKFIDDHFAPGQVYRNTQETQSWGRAILSPIETFSVTVKAGNALRKVSSFDAAALPPAENPLVRAFDQAARDRVFASVSASWSVLRTLTWSVEATLAKDDYRSSPLGLLADHQQQAATTLAWTPRETFSAWVDAGYQRLATLQNGFQGAAAPAWSVADRERYWNVGVGGRWVPQERWVVSADYLHAPTAADVDSTSGGQQQAFPQNWTRLDSTHLDVAYRWTTALNVHLRCTRETYHSSDWALAGIGASTVPDLASLGLTPYRDSVTLIALTASYRFGRGAGMPGAAN